MSFVNVSSNSQLGSVLRVMEDGQFRTLNQIATLTNYPEASVSARLRDLRKPQFGEFVVVRRAQNVYSNGRYRTVFQYRVEAKTVAKKARRNRF